MVKSFSPLALRTENFHVDSMRQHKKRSGSDRTPTHPERKHLSNKNPVPLFIVHYYDYLEPTVLLTTSTVTAWQEMMVLNLSHPAWP